MDTITNSQDGNISIRPETPPTPQETETLQATRTKCNKNSYLTVKKYSFGHFLYCIDFN